MSLDESFLEKLRQLPPEKQKEVVDFVDRLHKADAKRVPRRSPEGLWSDLGSHITEKDIAEIRAEIGSNFPRADI